MSFDIKSISIIHQLYTESLQPIDDQVGAFLSKKTYFQYAAHPSERPPATSSRPLPVDADPIHRP